MVDAENTASANPHAEVPATVVDARGLSCPMPLLKAKLALNNCQSGESVSVYATDAGSIRDFHSFADLSAHELTAFIEHEDFYEYVLRKGSAA